MSLKKYQAIIAVLKAYAKELGSSIELFRLVYLIAKAELSEQAKPELSGDDLLVNEKM